MHKVLHQAVARLPVQYHPARRRLFLQPVCASCRRHESTSAIISSSSSNETPAAPPAEIAENEQSRSNALDDTRQRKPLYFYIDTVFPIKLIRYDPRLLLAQAEKDSLLDRIKSSLPSDTGHGFRVESVTAREKDGGAFVKCSYIPDQPAPGQTDTALQEIVDRVIHAYNEKGERPWYSWKTSRAHLVKVGALRRQISDAVRY
jgi:hypothetical protein